MPLSIQATGAALGAVVTGVDLAHVGDADFARIRDAFHEHELLVLRCGEVSDEEHIGFSARFGPLRRVMFSQHLDQKHPEIFVVSNIVENGKPIAAHQGQTATVIDGQPGVMADRNDGCVWQLFFQQPHHCGLSIRLQGVGGLLDENPIGSMEKKPRKAQTLLLVGSENLLPILAAVELSAPVGQPHPLQHRRGAAIHRCPAAIEPARVHLQPHAHVL